METGKGIKIIVLIAILFFFSCVNDKSKKEHFSTKVICGDLYREKYRIFSGGAYSAELYADYITDSVNFRKFVGTHDPSEGFGYKCTNDTIVIEKAHFSSNKVRTLIEKNSFSINELKRSQRFE